MLIDAVLGRLERDAKQFVGWPRVQRLHIVGSFGRLGARMMNESWMSKGSPLKRPYVDMTHGPETWQRSLLHGLRNHTQAKKRQQCKRRLLTAIFRGTTSGPARNSHGWADFPFVLILSGAKTHPRF